MVINIYNELEKILNKDKLDLLLEYNSKPLPTAIRLNTLRMDKQKLEDLLQSYDIRTEIHPVLTYGYRLDEIPSEKAHKLIFKLRMLGYIYFQNFSSMLPPPSLLQNVKEQFNDVKIIDTCASPGSKTSQLSQIIMNKGLIVANDFSKKNHRAYILHRNLKLTGSLNVVVSMQDARMLGKKWSNYFDYALVDVPCTGSGVIREHQIPERFENDLKKLTTRQEKILSSAIDMVKPGGTIVYSTCSYLPQENEMILKPFIEEGLISISKFSHPNLPHEPGLTFFNEELPIELKKTIRIYPYHFNSVGFYLALLKVNKDKENNEFPSVKLKDKPVISKKNWKILENEEEVYFWDKLTLNWGITKKDSPGNILIQNRKGRIWLTNRAAIDFIQLHQNWHPPERLAVPVAQEERGTNNLRLTLDGILVFQSIINKQKIVTIDRENEEKWFTGKHIEISSPNDELIDSQFIILKTIDNLLVGCSKLHRNIAYNFLSKFRQYVGESDTIEELNKKKKDNYLMTVYEENK